MTRRGWTLHEMLIALVVVSAVMALAAHLAAGQLRFLHGARELATLRGDASEAAAIAAGLLRGISPADGDIVAASDSAIEFQTSTGAAVVCESAPGLLVVPARGASDGNTIASFVELPAAGDRMLALRLDSAAASWDALHVREASLGAATCAAIPSVSGTRVIQHDPLVQLPPGTPLRFARPLRLALYRSADGKWYLGAREWNAGAARFNTVQPVAGPLRSYSTDPARSGLHFSYRTRDGALLDPPVDVVRIGLIAIVARASSGRFSDSSSASVAFPSAP